MAWNNTTGNFYIGNIETEYKIWKRKKAIESLLSNKILDDSYSEFVKSGHCMGISSNLPYQKDYWL